MSNAETKARGERFLRLLVSSPPILLFLLGELRTMRLLDARALIHEGISRLVDDGDVGAPPYTILSHTWGREEVLYNDIFLGPSHEISPTPAGSRRSQGYRTDSRFRRGPKQFLRGYLDELEGEASEKKICHHCKSQHKIPNVMQGAHVKMGWNKVYNACLQTCRDGYDYIWIDTCCIDKSSSAELSEAINAMFNWYGSSEKCYVYFEDCTRCPNVRKYAGDRVTEMMRTGLSECDEAQVRNCRWLTRGWTLQEIIAPSKIEFFDRMWS